MDIGMNLPGMVPGLDRAAIEAWCRGIDEGPWSSLALGERVNFPNPDLTANGPYGLCQKCHDLSGQILQDDVLARLISLPNVLITSHQAFLTHEALGNIAQTTLETISAFEVGAVPENVLVKL